jgi:hypothetical protein
MRGIPQVRTWKVTVAETGEVLWIDTITRRMAALILKLDYPRLWGKSLKIVSVRQFKA